MSQSRAGTWQLEKRQLPSRALIRRSRTVFGEYVSSGLWAAFRMYVVGMP